MHITVENSRVYINSSHMASQSVLCGDAEIPRGDILDNLGTLLTKIIDSNQKHLLCKDCLLKYLSK